MIVQCDSCAQKMSFDESKYQAHALRLTCPRCGAKKIVEIAPKIEEVEEASRGVDPELIQKMRSQIPTLALWDWYHIIFYAIISLGQIYFIWFFARRDFLNSMRSGKKINTAFVITMSVFYLFPFFVLFSLLPLIVFNLFSLDILTMVYYGLFFLFGFIFWVLLLVLSFRVKAIIEEHYDIPISGVATFFFNIIYLQAKLKRRYIDDLKKSGIVIID